MRSTDPIRVQSACRPGPRSALRRPWSPSAGDVPTKTAERPSRPGRREISMRIQATKSTDSSYCECPIISATMLILRKEPSPVPSKKFGHPAHILLDGAKERRVFADDIESVAVFEPEAFMNKRPMGAIRQFQLANFLHHAFQVVLGSHGSALLGHERSSLRP